MGGKDAPLPPPANGIINREQKLTAGQEMYSQNGEYKMSVKEGRLVIEHVPTGREVKSWGEKGGDATGIRFEDETGKADKQQQLELVDDDGDTVDSDLRPKNADEALKGGAWFEDWSDPDNENKGAQQYILTNKGELIALKNPIRDLTKWDGERPPHADVLWYFEPPAVADRRAFDGYRFQIPAGADIKSFPLEIRIPPGTGTETFRTAVKVFNAQLYDIADQLGKAKPEKPSFLVNLGDVGDDNLAGDFYSPILGSGSTQEQVNSANFKLNTLSGGLKADEKDFDKRLDKITSWNLSTYQNMYNKIQDAHAAMTVSLAGPAVGPSGVLPAGMPPPTEQQIREASLYRIMAGAVQYCVDQLAEYTRQIEQLPPALRPPQTDAEKAAADKAAADKTTADKAAADKAAADKAAADKAAADKAAAAKAAADKAAAERAAAAAASQTAQQTAPARGPETPSSPAPADADTGSAPAADKDGLQVEALQNEDASIASDDLLSDSSDTPALSDDPTTEDTGNSGPSAGSEDGGTTAMPSAPTPQTAAAPAGNGIGDILGPLMAMTAMQSANQVSHQSADDRDQDRRTRDDRIRDRQAAVTAATNSPGAPTTPPGVTPPAYAGTPPPVTTPGRMVDYPIGRSTVHVPQPVAEALQRQTQNAAVTAKEAYAGTAGDSTADHPWATVNDVANLRTGDVVQWENYSALIVKNENGLNIFDNGQLIPLDPNDPPLTEKYGSFTGYLHPTGLDAGSGTAEPEAPAQPTVSVAQLSGPLPFGPPRA